VNTNTQYTAFTGFERTAGGTLENILPALWEKREEQSRTLVFENETGRQVDFDLSGTVQEVLERYLPPQQSKGPGRPRLGVLSREVSLLPRHWEWLERQPHKASGTLRRLVEAARKNQSEAEREREKIEAVDKFLWSIAGNLEGFEEAGRALYARDWSAFDRFTASWPQDVRNHLNRMLAPVREG